MDGRRWLTLGAGMSFFMAAVQLLLSLSPAAAGYFGAPPGLLADRTRLLLVGGGAALLPAAFGLYALSGAGRFRRLPLLRTGLVAIGGLYLLRGLFIVLTLLELLGIVKARILPQGVASHLVFLAAGLAYALGTAASWRALRPAR